jgi:hypothetical protein
VLATAAAAERLLEFLIEFHYKLLTLVKNSTNVKEGSFWIIKSYLFSMVNYGATKCG